MLKKTLSKAVLLAFLITGMASADVIYSVREGDTLETICKSFQLKKEAVLKANPDLTMTALTPGQILMLPEKPEAAEVDVKPVNDPIVLAGIQADPPKATEVALDEKSLAEMGKPRRYRRPQMSSRRGRILHGVTTSARRFIGVPYRMGGTTSRAFDCSGYVQRVFKMNGINLPRTADVQYNVGNKVQRGQEQPGDLVFFETYLPGPSHVGIYLGNGNFIHASSSRGVTISKLSDSYFGPRYIGAKRIF